VISNSEIKNQSDRAYSAAVKALRPKGLGTQGGGTNMIIPKVSLKKKGTGINVQSLLGSKNSGGAANFRTI